jgi:HPt (histidine-containing phosphotransfer) domain-containing protein
VSKALVIWRDATHFRTFLEKFSLRYADIVPNLRSASPPDAQAIAHKFRGAAAGLGLEDVATAAHTFEQLLNQGHDPEAGLAGLDMAMAVALDSIARYAAPPPPRGEQLTEAPDNADFRASETATELPSYSS